MIDTKQIFFSLIGKPANKIFDLATTIGKEAKAFMKQWLRDKFDLNI